MKLRPGNKAPNINTLDIFNNPIKSTDYHGKKLMLSFYRYASCPFCNLRINQLIKQYEELQEKDLHIVAVFQSPVENILSYVGKQDAPFPIIADPQRILYKKYGVQGNWMGFVKAGLKLKKLKEAADHGYLPGKMEGDISMIPADFLIDENHVIRTAFYGKDITDHLPFDEIKRFLT